MRVFGNYMKKSYCVREKYHWDHAITIPEISKQFFTQYIFFQPNGNSIDSFNANFKKQWKSVANQISNKAKNTNHNLDIDELINFRKLCTNNSIIGYLNINSLRNKLTQLREVCRVDLLCTDETKLDASFPDAQFHIEIYRHKNGGGKIIFIT